MKLHAYFSFLYIIVVQNVSYKCESLQEALTDLGMKISMSHTIIQRVQWTYLRPIWAHLFLKEVTEN